MNLIDIIKSYICVNCPKNINNEYDPLVPSKPYQKKYSLFIADEVSRELVENAIKFVPDFWEIVIVDDMDYYEDTSNTDFNGFLIPKYENNIIVFDGTKRKTKNAGGAFTDKIGIAVFNGETAFTIGIRFIHEMVHILYWDDEKYIADHMGTNTEYHNWLIFNPLMKEIMYYYYLLIKKI